MSDEVWNPRFASSDRPAPGSRLARRLVLGRFSELEEGRLEIVEGRQRWYFGNGRDLTARVRILDAGTWGRLLRRGPIGAAEAYMDGGWVCDDLVALIRLLARSARVWGELSGGLVTVGKALERVRHRLRRNTLRGSRRNIAAHYDLGNEFFALFLDPTLTYSSAVFDYEGQPLEEAQHAKYERLCTRLQLDESHSLLEIGTGWGGFAIHAAARHGCRVTTTTVSREQHALATRRVAEAGLDDRVEVLLEDYRSLTGTFDRIVSIEMIEAVGHEHLADYFRVCSERLAPDGSLAIQAILHRDQDWQASKHGVDFIKRYIFPGGQLPSVWGISEAMAGASDLRLGQLEDITAHYAETLRLWRAAFLARAAEVASLGLDERFRAMWDYYLAYCEGGFRERSITAAQLVFEKPASRLPSTGGLV